MFNLEFKGFIYSTKICEQAADTCRVMILVYVFIREDVQIIAIRTFALNTTSIIPTELYRQSGRRRPAKLVPTYADRGVSRGQRNGSPRPLISVFCTGAATFFYSSSASIDLTRLSGPRSRPTTTQKIW